MPVVLAFFLSFIAVILTEAPMIPRLLLAAVTACLAGEGYSVLTAPPSLIRAVVAKVAAEGQHSKSLNT